MTRVPRFAIAVAVAVLAPSVLPFVPAGLASVPAGNLGSFVVVAVVDTGINPYHTAFRGATYPRNLDLNPSNDVDFTVHPSSYITGYPADAEALPLTVQAADYASAVAQDSSKFSAMSENKLYWIPGTKIIGAYDAGDASFVNSNPDSTHLLDDDGHGSGSAGLAVGHVSSIKHSYCRECLLVVVEGSQGLRWAFSQPWIDVISVSLGTVGNVGFPNTFLLSNNDQGKAAVQRGQMVLYASGNGVEGAFVAPTITYTSSSVGPPWYLRVGGFSVCFGTENPCQQPEEPPVMASGKPMDISGPAAGNIPSAARDSLTRTTGFGGTSAATPSTASYVAGRLLTLRSALGDTEEGQRAGGIVANGAPIQGTPFPSVANDGVVTRVELRDLVLFNSAPPINNTVYTKVPPNAPGNYFWYGWGMANARARAQADNAALGLAPWLAKSEERRLAVFDKLAQESLWGQWDFTGDGTPDTYRTAATKELQFMIDELTP